MSTQATLSGGALREKVKKPKTSGTEWKSLFGERSFQKS
jgi:hypothetical protein